MSALTHAPTPTLAPAPTGPGAAGGFFAHHGVWAPGVRLFRQMRFMTKAMLISLAFVLPLLGLLGWQLLSGQAAAMAARQASTRQHVEIAHGVVAQAHALERAGTLTREQAQAQARATLAALRYDGSEYFWINDMQPRMVMHPIKPELDGREVGDMKDPNGLPLFQAFVETVRRQGQGVVAYQWPRPGAAQPVDKISYVKGFEPWGWVIGSGIYVDDLRTAQRRQIGIDAAVVAVSLLMAAYLFLSFYRVMDGGLKETRRHLKAMAAGDLTTSPSPWGRDEAAQLMLELRAMQESLRSMVVRVRRSSDEIVHSSSEIASGAMDLSSRTEQAAASLEESAASMEQISATVKNTAELTAEASRMAGQNAQIATDGGQVMAEVVSTMDSIRGSSARIGEIVGTIDAIAFQTNILALNASVEAARAGEQGRGFAVVAEEVRTLAQRSAQAAREIKSLIGQSVTQVENGSATVQRAGQAMHEIVASSQRVDELLGQVAAGAREQAMGISQIGTAVQELDRMTQQNAALVEESAAAATAMKEQAGSLAHEVDRFRLPAGAELAEAGEAGGHDDFDFEGAINAHRQWKVKLRQAIAKKEKLDAETICRDDRCPLGRWIHGDGGQRWGSRPVFVDLLARHADFHRAAGDVARRINAGAYAEAERLVGSGSVFAEVSVEVATLLTRAKRGM